VIVVVLVQALPDRGVLDLARKASRFGGKPIRLRLVTVAPWTLSVQPTYTVRGWTLRQIGTELGVY
jgi:hypothetical protein